MRTYRKITGIVSAVLASVLAVTLFSSCNSVKDVPETFSEEKTSVAKWNKYSFMTETFGYTELNPSNGKEVKKTASRIIKLDTVTGDVSHVCIDPVCTHEPDSDCPLVSADGLTCWTHSLGEWLPFTSDGNVSGKALKLYSLKTGEIRELLTVGENGNQISSSSFNGIMYIVFPDISDEKTVYRLRSYDPDADKWKNIAALDDSYFISAVTNKRIYLSKLGIELSYSDTPSFSLDYNGQNRRDEPAMKMAVTFKDGECCYGSQYRDLMLNDDVSSRVFAGYYVKYNVNTRETTRIPADEGATSLGLWNGKLVYATCKDVDKWIGINKFEYAREHGLDPNDASVGTAVNELRNEMMFGGSMYIKTCDLNGENSEILFEFPGTFIDNGTVSGDYMTASVSTINKETGHPEERKARINLKTGEIGDVVRYSVAKTEETFGE